MVRNPWFWTWTRGLIGFFLTLPVFTGQGNALLLSVLRPGPVPTPQEGDSPEKQTGIDWPGFLGPERNGKSAETGLRFDWQARPPEIVWSRRVGEGYAAGVVASGRYLHFDRDRDEARVVSLDSRSGKLLWEFRYPAGYRDLYGFDGGPRASPAIDGNRVYLFGVEGMLHCLDLQSGEVLWSVDTADRFGVVQNFFGVGSSPLVFGELLIVMIGGSPPESRLVPPGQLDRVVANGSGIVAFDKATGEVRYQTINDLASYSSPTMAMIAEKPVAIALMRSGLFAFDPQDGTELWSFPWRARKLESVNASTPVITAEGILITEAYGPGGALLPLRPGQEDPVNRVPIWQDSNRREKALACHWNTPIVIDGFAYGCSGEKKSTAELRCVRVADGSVRWTIPRLSRCSLTAADGHLIGLSETGKLFVFRPDPEKFDVVAELDPEQPGLIEPCWAAPFVSHGFLYLRDATKVYCLDIRR
jgi:outer membrane protein assembly factor BamB